MANRVEGATRRTVAALDVRPGNLLALERVISGAGYGFFGATSLDELVRVMDNHSPDLVLVDLDGLPVRDLAFLSEIKDRRIPFLVISSESSRLSPDDDSLIGPHSILTKPLALKRFLALVASLLEPDPVDA